MLKTRDETILYLVFLFTSASIAGWCLEVAFRSACHQGLVIPGLLMGPYCPIYGIGMVAATLLCGKKKRITVFAEIFVFASVLEYVVSAICEYLFHALLWDYSGIPFSIGTRVCPLFSIVWGIMGVVAVRRVEPHVHRFYRHHKEKADMTAAAVATIIAADMIVRIIS